MPSYFILDDAILEVTVPAKLADQNVMVLFHYRVSNTGFGVEYPGGFGAFDAIFNNAAGMTGALAGVMSDEVTFRPVVYQWIHPLRYGRQEIVNVNATGGVAFPALPPNEGFSITKRGIQAGRRFIGSTHVYGLPVRDQTLGQLNAFELDERANLADKIQTTITLAGGGPIFTPIIFSKSAPTTSPEIVGTVVQQTTRTERRRTVGLGI